MPQDTVRVHFQHSLALRRDQSEEENTLLLEGITEAITLEELIRRTVYEEIRLRTDSTTPTDISLTRRYLVQAEVDERAKRGKVSLKDDKVSLPDPEVEARRALKAFENGAFLVLVGKRQVERLNETLDFADQTSVTFVRLMPLAGG